MNESKEKKSFFFACHLTGCFDRCVSYENVCKTMTINVRPSYDKCNFYWLNIVSHDSIIIVDAAVQKFIQLKLFVFDVSLSLLLLRLIKCYCRRRCAAFNLLFRHIFFAFLDLRSTKTELDFVCLCVIRNYVKFNDSQFDEVKMKFSTFLLPIFHRSSPIDWSTNDANRIDVRMCLFVHSTLHHI